MANHELINFENIKQNDLLNEIRKPGLEALAKNPIIADLLETPGHHRGIFDYSSRRDGTIKTIEGRQYIDSASNYATGMIDSRWITQDPEFNEFVAKLVADAPTDSEFATPESVSFDLKMLSYSDFPEGAHNHCRNSGTDATDVAAKIMNAQVMVDHKFDPPEMKIVSFSHAFHGRNGFSQELTETTNKTEDWQDTPGRRRIQIAPPAIVFDELGNIDERATERNVATSLSQLEDIYKRTAKVSGIMLEYPFLAEGGAILLSPTFLKPMRELCLIYRRITAFDEVQIGGKGYPFPPVILDKADIIVYGKSFRVCGVLARNFMDRGFSIDHQAIPGKYGATWTGKPAEKVVALAMLHIIEKYNLWENGRNTRDFLHEGIRQLAEETGKVRRPRGWGSYEAFDLPTAEMRKTFIERMYDSEQVIAIGAGEKSIRVCFPIDIPQDIPSRFLEASRSVLSKI